MPGGRPVDLQIARDVVSRLLWLAQFAHEESLFVPPSEVPYYVQGFAVQLVDECRSERGAALALTLLDEPHLMGCITIRNRWTVKEVRRTLESVKLLSP
ncbi:MAG: hypothetical protein RL701_6962, partial [Pseudomonadota bacterium]